MKKALIIAMVIMVAVAGSALAATSALTIVGEDGFAVSASTAVSRMLNMGETEPVKMISVGYDDMLYSSLSGYYIGTERKAVDMAFPLFINQGNALRFLDEEAWLVTADVDILRTFDGLYLSDGCTFDSNRTQADAEEFILLVLTNGLYMNTEGATFTNRLGSSEIAMNSILYLDESAIRWYTPEGNMLIYDEEESVFDATLTIGTHTYNYADLLDALGLIREAIGKKEHGENTDALEQEAEELLNGGDDETNGNKNSATTKAEDAQNVPATVPVPEAVSETQREKENRLETPEETPPMTPDSGLEADGGWTGRNPDAAKTDSDVFSGNGAFSDDGHGSGDPEDETDDASETDDADETEDADDETDDAGSADDSTDNGEENSGGGKTGGSSGARGGRTDTTNTTGGDGRNAGEPDDSDEEGVVIEDAEPDPNAQSSSYRPAYRDPEVTLNDLEAWSYAVGGKLKIRDRSGAIQRGVKIAIYREVTKTKGTASPTTNEAGQKVYPSSAYEGKSAMTRRTYLGDQAVALSPLQPETTVYVQFSYRYNEEKTVDEDGNPYVNEDGEPVTVITRKTYYSDLVELKTLRVEDNVQPISIRWDVVYAAADRAMRLDSLSLKNTAAYRENLERFDFGNFKLDSLPYVNRLVYTLKDERGKTTDLTAGTTVVTKAQQQAGVSFTSSSQLNSNTKYTVAVKAYDRYGNEMPLRVDNETQQDVYTCKSMPTAVIEETENVTDKLSVKITVSDPDNALLKGEDGETLPLVLTAADDAGSDAMVGGYYKNGTKFGESGERELTLLPAPEKGNGSYELTLNSLAFAQAYTLRVLGNYNLQPDYDTETPLTALSRAVVGSLRTYTAALGTGTIAFSTSIPAEETLDTSAVIYATMNSRTTTSILPMIDEFRITVTDAATDEPAGETLVLDMTTLDDTGWSDYTEANGEVSVTVRQAAGVTGVTLSGAANQWAQANHSPWQAMLISSSTDAETGAETFSTPMTLRIALPENMLASSTRYKVTVDSVVIKSGVEYHIPTVLSVSQFTSKKIQPQVVYDDLFIAGDMLQFIDLYVYDPDGTILKDGTVTATLWYGADEPSGTRLAVVPLKASRVRDNEEGFEGYQSLRFDGLNAGADYYLWLKADEFNDAEGYTSYAFNKELLHEHFTGGSRLSGELELTNLEFDSTAEQTNIWEDMTWSGPQIADAIADGTLTKDGSNDRYITPRMEIPTDADGKRATFLQLQGYFAVRGPYIRAEYYYSDSTKVSLYYGVYVSRGATPTFMVPPEAKYVRFRLSDRQTLEQTGVRTAFYTTPQEDLYTTSLQTVYYDTENVPTPSYLRSGAELDTSSGIGTSGTSYHYLHMLPVKKGEVYTIGWQYSQSREDDLYGRVYFWTADKAFKGTYLAYRFSSITIPDDVGYMSVGCSSYLQPSTTQIMRVCESGSVDAYTAKVSVTVTDSYGYLRDDPKVTMTLRQAQTLYVTEAGDVDEDLSDYATQNFELIRHENEDGSVYWSLDDEKLLAALPPNKRFVAALTATYQGATVTLDTMEFRTDGPYGIIRCNEDMWQIVRNPWGNFIVTQPFEHYLDIGDDNYSLVNVYGSLDFQGHKITRRAGWTPVRRFINTVQGVVRNLYYEYPAPLTNEETGEPVILNVNRTVIFSVGARGLVENFVVATKGAIRVNHSYGTLMVYSCSGTVRNWILKLGGDVHLTRTDSASDLGIVCQSLTGALEDGYVYTEPDKGYGALFYNDESRAGTSHYFGGLAYITNYQGGEIRRVFSVFDSWFQSESNLSRSAVAATYNRGKIHDYYHVGEYYDYNGGGAAKNTNTPGAREHIVGADNIGAGALDNVYHITSRSYTKTTPLASAYNVTQAGADRLHDAAWQSSVLCAGLDGAESAFDVESCVEQGFYPRLKLSAVMRKYQDYVPLPGLSEDAAPTLVGDGWAKDLGYSAYGEPGADRGFIALRFRNQNLANIASVTISGLTVEAPVYQGLAADGLWDVVCYASVPEDGNYYSGYLVTGFTYGAAGSTRSAAASYMTQGVEFWKEISDVAGWRAINSNRYWNYRLTADLDFSNTPVGQLTINGNISNYTSTGIFYGKIDGRMHELKNMSNVTGYPYIFYQLDATNASGTRPICIGELRNLVVTGLNIQDTSAAGASYCGFVRYVSGGAMLSNIHIRNATVSGAKNCSVLAGAVNGYVRSCSVAESALTDVVNLGTLNAGGIVAYADSFCDVESCYVRDLTITAVNSQYLGGVGGIAGSTQNASFRDCYATGFIRAKGTRVGGILGYSRSSSPVYRAWSAVDIDVTGNTVGGMVGYHTTTMSGLVAGNIITSSGDYVHRAAGYGSSASVKYNQKVYAYSGQTVNNLSREDADGTQGLLDAAALRRLSSWTDLMRMGTYWDYGTLEWDTPCYPQVRNRDGSVVWGQDWTDSAAEYHPGIPLPDGQEYELEVVETSVDVVEGANRYTAQITLRHPGLNTSGMTSDALKARFPTVYDGMDLSDDAVFTMTGADGYTTLFIQNKYITKALDFYRLDVTYATNKTLSTQVDYGQPLYWDIPDLNTWNMRAADHGTSLENFRITGLVDFAGATGTPYRNLELNRLEGKSGDGGATCGFTRLYLNAGTGGDPWILSVANDVTDLSFLDLSFDASQTASAHERNGMIREVRGIHNCVEDGFTLTVNANSAAQAGLFGRAENLVSNVTVNNVTVTSTAASTGKNYIGGLVGYVGDGVSEITATAIDVNVPGQGYTGGVVGAIYHLHNLVNTMSNCSIRGTAERHVRVVGGGDYTGGFVGCVNSSNYCSADNYTAEYVDVTGGNCAGGLEGYSGRNIVNATVRNCTVTATRADGTTTNSLTHSAGGVAGYMSYYTVNGCLVENTVVKGRYKVGGVFGAGFGHIYNARVLGCTVTCNAENSDNSWCCAGGIGGYGFANYDFNRLTVRGTEVSALRRAGGVFGVMMNNNAGTGSSQYQWYVAEDVTVTAGQDMAGGAVGYCRNLRLADCVVGATVTAGTEIAGGAIGSWVYNSTVSVYQISNFIFRGTVSAPNGYAGGVVGQASSDLTLTPTQLKGLFVAASVNGGGGKTSLWLNDTSAANTQSNAAVYVWDQSTLNGQTAETLVSAGSAAGVGSIAVIPSGGSLITASDFRKTATYTNAGFNGTARWLFTRDAIEGSTPAYRLEEEGNLFMPYLRSANNGAGYLDSTRYYSYVKNGETKSSTAAGVLLPPFGESTEAKVAYASGVGTVNVEWKNEAGEYEVSTYPYDFRDEFSQSGVTKAADDLRRTVMAYGDWWYFLDNGKIVYGNMSAKGEAYVKAGDTELSGVVHLWQGKALTDSGKVYSLNGASATDDDVTVTNSDTPLENSVPFWCDAIGEVPLNVYYYFSDVGASRVDYRLFRLTADNSTTIHTVSASQGMVYDGVLLSAVNGATGIMRYHAVLSGSEKQLVNRLTTINSQNWSNQNVVQISNNLGYASPVVVLRYESGAVSVVNYSSDGLIYTSVQTVGLLSYMSGALRSFFGAMLGGSAIVMDEGYQGLDPAAISSGGTAAPTVNGVDSSSGADAAAVEEGESAEALVSAGDEAQAGSGVEDEEGADGTETVFGTGDPVDPAGAETVSGGAVSGFGEPMPVSGAGGPVPATAASTGAQMPEGETPAYVASAKSVQYRPGDGLYGSGGELLAAAERLDYVANKGLYVDGTLEYVEDARAAAPKDGSSIPMISVGEQRERLANTLTGTLIVYDPVAGEYVTLDGSSLLSGEQRPRTVSAEEMSAELPLTEDTFTVGTGLGRTLTQREQSGFAWLAVIGVAGATVLVMIYLRVRRKRG